ncbi:MAG: 3-deoxy-8-phosphooctulonate synthase [Pirellulaceae bacterium]|nr:3-deoxy-8-phosphooctulonate synthase [Pirellulaceae bacterium]
MSRLAKVQQLALGAGHPLALIAGPCVIESREMTLRIAAELKAIADKLKMPFIFKASFDKANRTSISSFRGVGFETGLKILSEVRETLGVPVTTDIHESVQVAEVAKHVSLLQIPAFLARQTDLLVAAAESGRAVNVKKGQFMAPADMQFVAEKLRAAGAENVLLTERGTFFGYGQLVNDMRAIPEMQRTNCPVIFDATHSVQRPSAANGKTGGDREMVKYLAAAAVAVGCDGLFLETHPNPDESPSDGPNMIPLAQMESLLVSLLKIRDAIS